MSPTAVAALSTALGWAIASAGPPEPLEIDDEASVVAPVEIDDDATVVVPESETAVEIVEITAPPAPTQDEAEPAPEPTPEVPEPPPEPPAPPPEPDTPHAQRWQAFIEHVHPAGFVQVDFLWRQISLDELSDGNREPLNETAFLLRNARLGVDADWRYVGLTAYADLFSNNQGVRPATLDAHAQIPGKRGDPPLVQLRVGMLRVPFGFENYNQSDIQRFFGERTLVVHAFMPGLFDVGASLSGHVWALDWIVGVYNGQPVGAPGWGFRDPNRAKDYAGRLRLAGELFPKLHAAFGVSLLTGTGFSAGTGPTKDSFVWVDLNEDGRVTLAELLPVPGSAGRPSENFRRWGAGADLQLETPIPRLGALTLYSEVAIGSNLDRAVAIADPVALGRDQRGIGWYLGLTQELTRYAALGVRFDEYLPNLDALEPFAGTNVITRRRFRTLAAGLAGRLYGGSFLRARLLVEYEHQLSNSLGRDAAGRPAKLDNDTLRVRAEVAF
ncbi:porin [Plesiocystis pacifica]|uniref:porin n=1 Tax=Plesiocystis pacifica TaxID=191768 RepID=UPI0012F72454|nr:porin [Plesiocystis pacifica]